MTRPNSSISNSKAWRYLALLAGLTLLQLAVVAAAVYGTRLDGRSRMAFQQLVDYQIRKIGSGPVPPVVFLGDSSLGNAVSTEHWERIGGGRAWNLALTGFYGYAGSLNLLTRLLEKGKPELVVIFNTVDMMQRPVEDEAYLMTARDEDVRWWQRLAIQWRQSMNMEEWKEARVYLSCRLRGKKSAANKTAQVFNDDYIRQGVKRHFSPETPGWTVSQVNPDKGYYLKRLRHLCDRHGLTCVYVHGPVAEVYCRTSQAYFRAVNRQLSVIGFAPLNPQPFCMTPEENGDTLDHIDPSAKAVYTERYYELLTPLLPLRPSAAGG